MNFLDAHKSELNPEQLRAVTTLNGPVLVLAGAGSGKTRVLTYRIAHLVRDHGVLLPQILAMTFSNKAAREMHERVKKLLGDDSQIRFPWISTFHSVCARLLRMYGSKLGFSSDFAIYDESEQLSLLKSVIEKMDLSEKDAAPEVILRRISEWKNEGMTAAGAERWVSQRSDEIASRVYRAYADALKSAQAMDFDDLLLLAFELVRTDDELRGRLQSQWRYILVDEFQDTNTLQYKLLRLLVNESRNLCVVGDDDQSIYGWRGAKVENILNFPKDFKPTTVVKLEQNYRSTGNILKAAHAIISKNELRHAKKLWTDQPSGVRISVRSLPDDRWESRFVVSEIFRLVNQQRVPASEIAVLYRVNSLSRGFEEECLRQRIPYQIVGGFRFYERKEIKDVLSHLRVLLNPADIISWRRSISSPSRGVGGKSVEKIEQEAALRANVPLVQAMSELSSSIVSGRARVAFEEYQKFLRWGFQALRSSESLVDLFVEALRLSRYVESLEEEKTAESADRIENIRELLSAVQEFEENWQPQEGLATEPARQKLRDFLERVSLMTDLDQIKETQELVTFMSLHAAKGLEFRYCFLAGMEEGLLPSSRSFDDYQRSEEERRLCYVGFTRAKERLVLTRADRRRTFGSYNFNLPSRFLRDLPPDILDVHVEKDDESRSSFGWTPRRNRFDEHADDRFDEDFDQRGPLDFEGGLTSEEGAAFKRGDRVKHPSFGEGIVQKMEMIGSDPCLSIAFPGRGLKKVLAKFVAKLSILLMAILPLLSGCVARQDPVTRSEKLIWSPPLQTWISEAEVISLARAADIVLIGETHDNSYHHNRQARVISGLRSPESPMVVGFEHIPARLQPLLDTFRHGDSRDLNQLGRDLQWEKLGWPDWKIFAPVFRAAFDSGALVIALDGMVKLGQPSKQDLMARQMFRSFPQATRRSLLNEMKASHCGRVSETVATRMAETQVKRDLNMISRMNALSPVGSKQIYVVGRGHARKDWGIPAQLRKLRPGARVLSIGLVEEMPELAGLGSKFDLVWITPAVRRPDPCAR